MDVASFDVTSLCLGLLSLEPFKKYQMTVTSYSRNILRPKEPKESKRELIYLFSDCIQEMVSRER